MVWALLVAWTGCGGDGIEVHDREVRAGCGKCVFDLPEATTCFWAVELDGKAYPVGGVHPPDDMITAHQPGGMCAQPRKARVDGSIRPDGRFVATRFDLIPMDGTEVPTTPDHH